MQTLHCDVSPRILHAQNFGAVGQSGRVLAEDIRRSPLVFLWPRTFQRRQHNVSIMLGEPDDPHLPMQGVHAVPIAHTYHVTCTDPWFRADVWSWSIVNRSRPN